MSDYSQFLRWQAGCVDRGGYGVTSSDTFHQGLRDYNQPYPCPNGMAIDDRKPGQVPAWRRRVEKAKEDIRQHQRQFAVRLLAESITDEQARAAAERIRTWANS